VIFVFPERERGIGFIRAFALSRMELVQLAEALVAFGCPPEKSAEMAAQLDKRARQLAGTKGRSYEEAMAHLLGLMRQGWSAKEKGV